MSEAKEEWTVSEVVYSIKNNLESEFVSLFVTGEVSNLSASTAGHYYFNLSDSDASLSCALFRGDALRNPEVKKIKNGDKITCTGSISVYVKKGQFQLIVKRVSAAGRGTLFEQYEVLKKKLASEGLFDVENKKIIPKFPKRVAIITTPGGAALQDFLNIFERRSISMDIVLIPAVVQGDGSAASLRAALHRCIEYHLKSAPEKQFDVIVLGRGGGAIEDLWSFNDEALAWDIYNCPVPTISAVGHQVDFTIADFVADFRAETPSAAAEVLTEYQVSVKENLSNQIRHLHQQMTSILSVKKSVLSARHPQKAIQKLISNIFELKHRFVKLHFEERSLQLLRLDEKLQQMDEFEVRLLDSMSERISEEKEKLEHKFQILESLNPKNVLNRGYSFVTSQKGDCISNTKDFETLTNESELTLHFHDGIGQVVKRSSL